MWRNPWARGSFQQLFFRCLFESIFKPDFWHFICLLVNFFSFIGDRISAPSGYSWGFFSFYTRFIHIVRYRHKLKYLVVHAGLSVIFLHRLKFISIGGWTEQDGRPVGAPRIRRGEAAESVGAAALQRAPGRDAAVAYGTGMKHSPAVIIRTLI